jgi:hypothetical protein
LKLTEEEFQGIQEEMQGIPYKAAVGSLMYAMVGTRPDLLKIRGEIAHSKAHRSHKYVNNAWRESSNSPPTLLFLPFPIPPH